MQVRDLMKKGVVTIDQQETIKVAAEKMRNANIGCLVVTNADTVKGIITDRDLAVRCVGDGHNPQQCPVSHHMSSPVTSTTPDADVLGTLEVMTTKMVKRLPVIEDGHLVGMVSFSDVAAALDQPMHELLIGMGAVRRQASAA